MSFILEYIELLLQPVQNSKNSVGKAIAWILTIIGFIVLIGVAISVARYL
jgi:hypothetical protein